ncbi:Uncharacterised protein [Candidatus Burarchaeum australiense]|nr:Uncharacterised protein [Candidatus Burarchaeum australiense]
MVERVYEINVSERLKLDTVLKADPYEDLSFSKQGYKLKEGAAAGGEAGKLYVYTSGDDAFFKYAEVKMKEAGVESAKRTAPATESKIIALIHEEDANAEQGFGAIFG